MTCRLFAALVMVINHLVLTYPSNPQLLLTRNPLQPTYQEFHSTAKSPKLFLSALKLLREVHNAGYVHGDKKAANFLVDGQVLVSDVKGLARSNSSRPVDIVALSRTCISQRIRAGRPPEPQPLG